MKKYREYLESEYRRAVADFHEAKEESVKCIQKMDVEKATDFGACYASYADKITAAASRVRALGQAIRMLYAVSESV